jgi:UDP-2,3-diacylglucosamine hydrolase
VNACDLFVSDVHLSHRSADRQRALLVFLRRHGRGAARVFILGDLFNAWIGRKQLAEPYVGEICDAVGELTASGVEVHFVAGNRDFYGLAAIAERTGMVTHKHGFATESFGSHIWVCHGHRLYVHDRRTHLAQRITHSRPIEWLFQMLPAGLATFLARGYENHSSRAVAYKSPRMLSIDDAALVETFEAGHEAVVCGHTHQLAHVTYRWPGGEGHLWNLGSWEQQPHFLRHGPDGWHFHTLST